MKLYYRETGEGPALIIIHGLYGSSDNWMSIARKLSPYFHVYLIDQRNHGHSPHSDVHDYPSMCEDLAGFISEKNIVRPVILGHSMGGKTAMFYATCHPEEVSALVVVDISPRTYVIREDSGERFSGHRKIMEAILHLDTGKLTSRQEALKALEKDIPSERVRQFLLKNLYRDKDNRFRWRLNISALYHHLSDILKGLEQDPLVAGKSFTGFPVLFIRGSHSTYIQDEDIKLISNIFPYAETVTIPDAGHWVHAEQPERFLKAVLSFLLD
ncbi:MAG: alpha/beta fold hydrolase [Chlorobi bacterium]|nr:alpha/beta fold hydrolase [Chlorobiota bacterium]